MTVNETRNHAISEKIEVLQYTISGLLQMGLYFAYSFQFH